ncbi:hypothetical protein [Streptomyces sp. NPDC050121]|uniref:hypothetical protein n=1 Tax=Streptomyces sp. NPDC050121 TaxID=3365601 RepID=UPI0037BCE05A
MSPVTGSGPERRPTRCPTCVATLRSATALSPFAASCPNRLATPWYQFASCCHHNRYASLARAR